MSTGFKIKIKIVTFGIAFLLISMYLKFFIILIKIFVSKIKYSYL